MKTLSSLFKLNAESRAQIDDFTIETNDRDHLIAQPK